MEHKADLSANANRADRLLSCAELSRADIIERINSIERKINVRIRSSAVLGRLNHSSIILKSREGA